MTTAPFTSPPFTLKSRYEALREAKLAHTAEKWRVIGTMNHDDWGLVLPPPEHREVVRAMSGSGVPITDVRLSDIPIEPNHPSGGFFGPAAVGRAFRVLLERHPTYLDPASSLAGATMANFLSYRAPHWNPDLRYDHLHEEQRKYKIVTGIGATQHFCPDLAIGLELGWGGLLQKIAAFREANAPRAADLYAGLADVVLGMQDWIARHASAARAMARAEQREEARRNLEEIATMNERLVSEPPATFREACQWLLWYLVAARMFNGSGAVGRLDALLRPLYERDRAAGTLTDEEAAFHIACLLLRDTGYIQLGGPDEGGGDATNPVSYLVLEAAHRLRVPANLGVCVGEGIDPGLLRRGVEVLFEDRLGVPKFLGVDRTAEGFARNGYPLELARRRAYSGCHWLALPGAEYAMNDLVKVNLAAVFEVALREMLEGPASPSLAELWERFTAHLRRAVEVTAEGLDFHLRHIGDVFPELVLDLLCHGTIERGLDAAAGGVDHVNLCVDGAALATVADSFGACARWIEEEGRLTWAELRRLLESDWDGEEGERARTLMKRGPRFGCGGTVSDEYAVRIARLFADLVKERPTPDGHNMIPGLFSWASMIDMGRGIGATPNGRRAGSPISHGPNPDPGFRRDSAPTALAVAVAAVQPGWGNTAPLQLDLDPGVGRDPEGIARVSALIRTHFALGGTQINMNVLNREQVLEAHRDPSKHPDLVVRVTGFSAYFASLSPEFRQIVVDRIVSGA
ncbi:MAG TPA: pyruvate formate lyase family protein [Chthonomonadales bacterium]|nr:pyruvate formate lyase family protein [Chthonomonadales bacterium]